MNRYIFPLVTILGAASACATSNEAKPATAPEEVAQEARQPESAQALGRELTAQFHAGEVAPIWARMTPQMRDALGSEEKLAAFQQQVEAQLGRETELLDEQVTESPPHQVYLRTARFSKFAGPVAVQWAFDEAGNVAGFFVRPAQ